MIVSFVHDTSHTPNNPLYFCSSLLPTLLPSSPEQTLVIRRTDKPTDNTANFFTHYLGSDFKAPQWLVKVPPWF